MNNLDRVKNRTPSGPSSENIPPRPLTTSMVSRVGVDPISHPDTAILAMLLAA